MTALPTVHVFTPGEIATAANINLYGTAINYLLNPPVVEIRQTVAQSVATGSTPVSGLTFTTEDEDNSGMHSTVTNTSRCTAVYPGWYDWGGGVGFVANATGSRGGAWAVNGTMLNGSYSWIPANGSGLTATPMRGKKAFLNIGDWIELWSSQTSGAGLNTSVTSIEQSSMSGKFVSGS